MVYIKIILCLCFFGCLIISDCGRALIWKIQKRIQSSEWWAKFLILWKDFRKQWDTGFGLCPEALFQKLWQGKHVPEQNKLREAISLAPLGGIRV